MFFMFYWFCSSVYVVHSSREPNKFYLLRSVDMSHILLVGSPPTLFFSCSIYQRNRVICLVAFSIAFILYLQDVVFPLFPVNSSLNLKAWSDSSFCFAFFFFFLWWGEGRDKGTSEMVVFTSIRKIQVLVAILVMLAAIYDHCYTHKSLGIASKLVMFYHSFSIY